jgi:dipeptidase
MGGKLRAAIDKNSQSLTWIAPGVMSAVGYPPLFARNQSYEEGSNGIA